MESNLVAIFNTRSFRLAEYPEVDSSIPNWTRGAVKKIRVSLRRTSGRVARSRKSVDSDGRDGCARSNATLFTRCIATSMMMHRSRTGGFPVEQSVGPRAPKDRLSK